MKNKPTMKIRISKLDKLFSDYIRSRDKWTCQRCNTRYKPPTSGLHCSHFWGRRMKSVRFDTENCVALCHGCHVYFTGNPYLHTEFMKSRLGEKQFDLLMLRANSPQRPDYKALYMAYSVLKKWGKF